MIPLTCAIGSVSPSVTSVLVTVKLGTWGRKSYGFGGVGRSAIGGLPPGRGGGRGGAAPPLRDPPGPRTGDAAAFGAHRSAFTGSVPGVLGLPDRIRACLFDMD